MEIVRDRANHHIALTQYKLISSMLNKVGGVPDCQQTTEYGRSCRKSRRWDTRWVGIQDGQYAEMVGSLLYVSVCTRPDIQHAASVLAKYMSCPTKELMRHAVHVFVESQLSQSLLLKIAPR
jgi:hypothetical protein